MKQTIAHAHSTNRVTHFAQYAYLKRATTERFDEKGQLRERQEKLMKFQSGLGSVVEMKVNGRPVSAAELRRQEAEMAQKRQQLTESSSGVRNDYWEMFLTPELASKYTFHLAGQQVVNNRPTYVLSFRPSRADLPVDKMADRLMNQMTGKLWIDVEEFEIARAELSLQSEATLWGGMLASLKKFSFNVERLRLSDGTWFNRITTGEFAGRKLLEPFHMRTRTETSDFRKICEQARK